jgi:cytochrome P450
MNLPTPVRVLDAPVWVFVTGTLFLGTFLLYRWLLPTPIPGIPYNQDALNSIFGDIPSMLEHLKTHKTLSDWLIAHNHRHGSPMVQVFSNLFQKPWVVISDFGEMQDILMRRTKEFDKPDMLSDIFTSLVPEHHTVKPTNDAFRYQRKLMQDLMAPGFLNGVAAPQLHANFMDLVKLWSEKARLSDGHPFSVRTDIYQTALEAIWAAVFSTEGAATITRNQIDSLRALKSFDLPTSVEEEVEFAPAPAPPVYAAVLRITDGVEHILKSPFPKYMGLLRRQFPSVRRDLNLVDRTMSEEISKAEARMVESKGGDGKITNAVDHMLRREKMAAEKQGRAPNYQSKVMASELLGLLIAGHDTTSTTLLWAMKFFATHQSVQTKFRTALRSAYSTAYRENRVPSAQEIATTQSHYIDACLEEIIRCAQTGIIYTRTAKMDAVVLGQVIPKGTRMMLCGHGGGIHEVPFEIDGKLRSEQYRNADGGKVGSWEPTSIKKFNPDRWLVDDKTSNTKVFDSQAGPHMMFGAGPRGCFGRKLAYLELRLALVLILWHFELQPVPEAYASWEAMEQLTHSPIQCYVKLAKA